MKTTAYFDATRKRPDRAWIREAWIIDAINHPDSEEVQMDQRVRRWKRIIDANNRILRVILLPDGETVHNAFFDRGAQ